MNKGKPAHILVVIQNSWGEVDWILPLLFRLKESAGARIQVYFSLEQVLEQAAMYKDLARGLELAAERVLGPEAVVGLARGLAVRTKLAWEALPSGRAWSALVNDPAERLLPVELLRAVLPAAPDLLLHDYSGEGHAQHHKAFPDARVVMFPHGTADFSQASSELVQLVARGFQEQPPPPDAALLAGGSEDADFFRRAASSRNIHVVGHPMFDADWRERLRGLGPDLPAPERPRLVLLLIPKHKFADAALCRRLILDVAAVARELGRELVVKAHPRQGKAEIEEIRELLGRQARFSELSVHGDPRPGDVAVCFPTSACHQLVVNQTPVVEYFDYGAQAWPSFLDTPRGKTSVYRRKGLALPAETKEELADLCGRLFQDAAFHAHTVEAQSGNFKASGYKDHGNVEAAAGVLLSMLHSRR